MTKGNAERPIRYLRESFVYARDFLREEDINALAHIWLSGMVNVRRQRTTEEKPLERFTPSIPLLLHVR